MGTPEPRTTFGERGKEESVRASGSYILYEYI